MVGVVRTGRDRGTHRHSRADHAAADVGRRRSQRRPVVRFDGSTTRSCEGVATRTWRQSLHSFMVTQPKIRLRHVRQRIWGSGGDPRLYLQRGSFRYESSNVVDLHPVDQGRRFRCSCTTARSRSAPPKRAMSEWQRSAVVRIRQRRHWRFLLERLQELRGDMRNRRLDRLLVLRNVKPSSVPGRKVWHP